MTFSEANQIALNAGTIYVFVVNLSDMTTDGNPTSGIYMAAHSDGTGYLGNPSVLQQRLQLLDDRSTYDVIFKTNTNRITRYARVNVRIGGDCSISAKSL